MPCYISICWTKGYKIAFEGCIVTTTVSRLNLPGTFMPWDTPIIFISSISYDIQFLMLYDLCILHYYSDKRRRKPRFHSKRCQYPYNLTFTTTPSTIQHLWRRLQIVNRVRKATAGPVHTMPDSFCIEFLTNWIWKFVRLTQKRIQFWALFARLHCVSDYFTE